MSSGCSLGSSGPLFPSQIHVRTLRPLKVLGLHTFDLPSSKCHDLSALHSDPIRTPFLRNTEVGNSLVTSVLPIFQELQVCPSAMPCIGLCCAFEQIGTDQIPEYFTYGFTGATPGAIRTGPFRA